MDYLYLVAIPGLIFTWSYVIAGSVWRRAIQSGPRPSRGRVGPRTAASRALGDFRVVGGFFVLIALSLIQWMSIPASASWRYVLLAAIPAALGVGVFAVVGRRPRDAG